VPTKRGSQLISLRLDGGRSYTIASFASPNRATLITVTLGPNQEFRIGQYLLPMAHLVGELDTTVAIRLEYRNQLLDVEHLARLMRAFRTRRDISKEVSDAELAELLYAKWLDPISTAMAAYELIRRGRMELMDEGDNCAVPLTRTKTDAVGLRALSVNNRFSGMTIMTRAESTWSSWLMVRDSSPSMARA